MERDDLTLQLIGDRLRKMYGLSDREPLTWELIDKLETLAEIENAEPAVERDREVGEPRKTTGEK